MSDSPGTAVETIREFYRLIDAVEFDQAFEMFSEDAVVSFGDQPLLVGKDVISERIRGLNTMAKSWTHEFVHTYEVSGPGDETTAIFEGIVTYEMRHSGNLIPHKAVMVDIVNPDGKITVQRNVGDLSVVFADHAEHAPTGAEH
jgi:hypothetical protein